MIAVNSHFLSSSVASSNTVSTDVAFLPVALWVIVLVSVIAVTLPLLMCIGNYRWSCLGCRFGRCCKAVRRKRRPATPRPPPAPAPGRCRSLWSYLMCCTCRCRHRDATDRQSLTASQQAGTAPHRSVIPTTLDRDDSINRSDVESLLDGVAGGGTPPSSPRATLLPPSGTSTPGASEPENPEKEVNFLALMAVVFAVERIGFSIAANLFMFASDPAKRPFLIAQGVGVGVILVVGVVVVLLFSTEVKNCYPADSAQGRALAAYLIEHRGVVKTVKTLALVKPAVLGVLQCYVTDSTSIPLDSDFGGWRCVRPSRRWGSVVTFGRLPSQHCIRVSACNVVSRSP